MLTNTLKKSIAAAGAVIVLTLAAVSPAAANNWQNLNSPAGFSVQLPAAPDRSTSPAVVPGETTPSTNLVVRLQRETFVVTFAAVLTSFDPEKMITDVRNGLTGKDTLMSETSYSQDGRPARQVMISTKEQLLIARIIVDGSRVYQVVYGTRNAQASPAATTFLNSFRLTR